MLALSLTTFIIQSVARSLHYFPCAAHALGQPLFLSCGVAMWSVALELFDLLCTSCLDVANAAYDDCPGKPNFCMVFSLQNVGRCAPASCARKRNLQVDLVLPGPAGLCCRKCRLQLLLHRPSFQVLRQAPEALSCGYGLFVANAVTALLFRSVSSTGHVLGYWCVCSSGLQAAGYLETVSLSP